MNARLNEEGMKIWGSVFPNREVPLKGIQSFKADLDKRGETEVYLVDWAWLSQEKRDHVLGILQRKFGSSRETILEEINRNGLPLRASLVSSVSIPARFL